MYERSLHFTEATLVITTRSRCWLTELSAVPRWTAKSTLVNSCQSISMQKSSYVPHGVCLLNARLWVSNWCSLPMLFCTGLQSADFNSHRSVSILCILLSIVTGWYVSICWIMLTCNLSCSVKSVWHYSICHMANTSIGSESKGQCWVLSFKSSVVSRDVKFIFFQIQTSFLKFEFNSNLV